MPEGTLALVVGPSGAGKDTLIAAARRALQEDGRFVFPRRVVTRVAMDAIEDHDSLPRETFEIRRRQGAYALSWEAHGLCYGVPATIDEGIAAGRVVVCNVSRRAIAAASGRYRRCLVMLVTADAQLREQRLVGRGREDASGVAERLERDGAEVPAGTRVLKLDNSGTVAEACNAFIAALLAVAGDEPKPG
jgi:ribose 1,5-bisphosphokinase